MLDGSFDIAPAIRDLAVELDVLRRRVRLLEDAVAALSAPAVEADGEPTSASSVGSVGRKGSKREKALSDGAADAG